MAWVSQPDALLRELAATLQEAPALDPRGEQDRTASLLEQLKGQRDVVLTLFRRGRIDALALDQQLDQIDAEERHLRERLEMLTRDVDRLSHRTGVMDYAGETLERIGRYVASGEVPFEVRRQVVEILVGGITVEPWRDKGVVVTARFRFGGGVDADVGVDCEPHPWGCVPQSTQIIRQWHLTRRKCVRVGVG